MTATSRRMGIALAGFVSVFSATHEALRPGASPDRGWWAELVEVLQPESETPEAPRREPRGNSVRPAPEGPALGEVATPKSRCHLIINGVVQEYECD